MLQIEQKIIDSIIQHALKDTPMEACGYLAEKNGMVAFQLPLTNTDASREHFSLDPAEQFDAVRKIRALGMKLKAVYHSHPASPARPSQEDIRLAFDQNLSYVIVSLYESLATIKSFLITKGVATEEHMVII